MNKFINILAFLFAAFLLFSCEPTRDVNGDYLSGILSPGETGGGGNGGGTTNRLLKKMISRSIDEDSGEWVTETLNYNYTNGRLVSYDADGGEKFNFDYNTSNKISKMYSTGQSSVFEYGGGNLNKITTTIDGLGKITASFTYANGRLSKTVSIQEYSVPFPIKLYLETTHEYTGENITKSTIKNGIYLPNGELEMNPAEDQTLSFTYDAKKSPYKLLPKEFIIWMAGIAPQGGAFLSANNISTFTISLAGNSQTPVNYTYTYDSENYPIRSVTDGEESIIFEYQN